MPKKDNSLVQVPKDKSELMKLMATQLKSDLSKGFGGFQAYFKPRLERRFLKNGLTQTEAEDLADEVIEIAANKIHSYKKEENFEGWVNTIAIRKFIDRKRQRDRDDFCTVPLFIDQSSSIIAPNIDKEIVEVRFGINSSDNWLSEVVPEGYVELASEKKEIAEAVNYAIGKLSAKNQDTFFYSQAGFTTTEIAKKLNVTDGSIRIQRLRIKDEIARSLETRPWFQKYTSFIRQRREHYLDRLRKEQRKIGFVPITFADYLIGLAKPGKVNLEAIALWFEILDLQKPSLDSSPSFGRLGKEIGLKLQEVLLQIRLGFLKLVNPNDLPLLPVRFRSTQAPNQGVEQYQTMLDSLEASYSDQDWRTVRLIKSEINKVYTEPK